MKEIFLKIAISALYFSSDQMGQLMEFRNIMGCETVRARFVNLVATLSARTTLIYVSERKTEFCFFIKESYKKLVKLAFLLTSQMGLISCKGHNLFIFGT